MKLCSVGALLILLSGAGLILGDEFSQTNLVSDTSGMGAVTIDPNLVDAWGMSFGAATPIWVSDRATGKTSLYTGTGASAGFGPFGVPPGAPNGPTGQVFAGGPPFMANGGPAFFIFATLGGTIDAWGPKSGASASLEWTTPGARYEGLAIANNTLFASNFTSGGGIDVFNSSYSPVSTSGKFTDSSIPSGYAPFNVQYLNGFLYVTYAKLTPGVPVPLPGGGGYVDKYGTSGNLVTSKLISNGNLNAPWGITIAPAGFGSIGGDLLIGNFGNGEINVYTTSGTWAETLTDSSGKPISINGLWALDFGNGSNGASKSALYFTAGPNLGAHGLFGNVTSVPEPGAVGTAAVGLLALIGFALGRRLNERA